jgi:hypothetical protein
MRICAGHRLCRCAVLAKDSAEEALNPGLAAVNTPAERVADIKARLGRVEQLPRAANQIR